MNTVRAGLSFLAVFACCLNPHNLFSQSTSQKDWNPKKVPVIELSGSGYSRGLQHGHALKSEIAGIFHKWKASIYKDTKQNADSVIARFYGATNFEPAIKKWTPDLYEEIKGISRGSGQRFIDVFCFQLMDEFWVYLDKLEHTQKHHCSGIGVAGTPGHPAYIAQNMDIESYTNGYQNLLHLAANGNEPEQYLLSCAGLIVLNGVNKNGVAVCVNTLMDLKASTDGLPVACVIRGILARSGREDILAFVRQIRHASGQNYIIGIGDSVYDFEASATQVTRFIPNPGNYSLVYHTNHAIANTDIKPWYMENHKMVLAGQSKTNNSFVRFTSLKTRLGAGEPNVSNASNTSNISTDVIKQTLRSKDDAQNPICRAYAPNHGGFTFSSVIFTLGSSPSVQITNGSPDQSEYVEHRFKN
jgi:isopenicillin-N N-acyltransferase-like protein